MKSKPVFFKLELPKPDPKIPSVLEITICARHQGTFNSLIPKIVESELDDYIDRVIRELEQIRQQA
jgi:hypothetical protein